ncbi:MAG: tetraacyldisaccharide 4'-kinase [Acidobacteriota bacterium]
MRAFPGKPQAGSRVLVPLSWAFQLVVNARNKAYDAGWLRQHRLPIPVVSVGNLATGGTGKTPLVILLARCLQRSGRHPAVISRGYRGANETRPRHPPLVVSDGRAEGIPMPPAAETGDEARLLACRLDGIPVIVCPDRASAGRLAMDRFHTDLILLDDGFQHRSLHRDADVVTLDAADPLSGGRLLPAGGLREPVAGLRRADIAVITRAEREDQFLRSQERVGEIAPKVAVFRAYHRPTRVSWPGETSSSPAGHAPSPHTAAASSLADVPVAAFAGLARPDSFRSTLEALGARVVHFVGLEDHHAYTMEEAHRLVEDGFRKGARLVLTTSKDAARLPHRWIPSRLAVLDIEMVVENLDSLVQRILALCLQRFTAPHPVTSR